MNTLAYSHCHLKAHQVIKKCPTAVEKGIQASPFDGNKIKNDLHWLCEAENGRMEKLEMEKRNFFDICIFLQMFS